MVFSTAPTKELPARRGSEDEAGAAPDRVEGLVEREIGAAALGAFPSRVGHGTGTAAVEHLQAHHVPVVGHSGQAGFTGNRQGQDGLMSLAQVAQRIGAQRTHGLGSRLQVGFHLGRSTGSGGGCSARWR